MGASPAARYARTVGDNCVVTDAHIAAELRQLALAYGLQPTFYDVFHRRRTASPQAQLQVLKALGAPLQSLRDVGSALRQRRQSTWQRAVEPVVVIRAESAARIEARIPGRFASEAARYALTLENGEMLEWRQDLAAASTLRTEEVEGVSYMAKGLRLPGLPVGYHHLRVELGGQVSQAMIIAAPPKAYTIPRPANDRLWGVFLPLYALHRKSSWGGGDFSDLKAFVGWVSERGGDIIGMLPLLTTFLGEPFDPSPYSPASRLFWSELYIDVTNAPELERCPTAQRLMASSTVQKELDVLKTSPTIDYRRQMALKRRVLEELASSFFQNPAGRSASFQRYLKTHPAVEDYARFRAAGERLGPKWPLWERPQREGLLKEGDYAEVTKQYHLYVQWLAGEQLESVAQRAQEADVRLYLDYPLGVHRLSYDVWRERESFTADVAAGAPPDASYTKGQNWGFPPLHPERLRGQGYRYFIDALRHHLALGGVLRLDHVLSLHRLYWIPEGMETQEGAYVRYPTEELYAILKVESHRYKSLIVGEDLGTIPHFVPATMSRHGIRGLNVMQRKLTADKERPLPPVPALTVASLNNHDMPPFAAFLSQTDIKDRYDLGLLDDRGVVSAQKTRQQVLDALIHHLEREGYNVGRDPAAPALLRACLTFLAASPAEVLLVNLEDLWLETQPQNVPTTLQERPNWRRKARHGFEEFRNMPQVLDLLKEVARIRGKGQESNKKAREPQVIKA